MTEDATQDFAKRLVQRAVNDNGPPTVNIKALARQILAQYPATNEREAMDVLLAIAKQRGLAVLFD